MDLQLWIISASKFMKLALEGLAEGKAESIKNLMSTLNVSIDQAMDILKTPPEERQYFKDLLAKEL